MQRVLVGVDISPEARDALGWAADLARRADVGLVAARVFTPAQAELPPDQDAEFHRRELRELRDWAAAVSVDGPTIDTRLLDGHIPDALLATADDLDADLLVVGGRGSGGFLHLHIGSVTHHLLHHTTRPLAIVPRSGAASIEHLVVGVDGSSGCVAAVEFCADLARALGVGVTAVHAYEPLVEWVPGLDPTKWHRRAEEALQGWTAPIEEAGVPLELDTRQDHPVAAIARALDAESGATAVVGTRGIGGFAGLRLGGVPLQLVHHTGASVIAVPPGTGTDPGTDSA